MGHTMFEFDVRLFEAKNRVFEFDYQKMNMFEFVQCSKIGLRVRSMFDKMVFYTSLVFDLLLAFVYLPQMSFCHFSAKNS